MSSESSDDTPPAHKRRPRYRGTHPRRFEDKYKELNPGLYPEESAKVVAAGKTPAGQHLPIMVAEVLDCLKPQPGERVVDCTLGYGGHAQALWRTVQPGGQVLGLDADPLEITRTESRLRAAGIGAEGFTVRRCNFAGLAKALAEQGWHDGVDIIFADLGLSSMQIDNPTRGFSFKREGPLDMRMNPQRGQSAAQLLVSVTSEKLERILTENADEPRAALLADRLTRAAREAPITDTRVLAATISRVLPASIRSDEIDATVRRVFQALRIEVNDEFKVLETLLRSLPDALKPRGRAAFLTFHSGEDRRVKRAFQEGERSGVYANVSREVVRASAQEQRANPRSSSAKLRWAVKAA